VPILILHLSRGSAPGTSVWTPDVHLITAQWRDDPRFNYWADDDENAFLLIDPKHAFLKWDSAFQLRLAFSTCQCLCLYIFKNCNFLTDTSHGHNRMCTTNSLITQYCASRIGNDCFTYSNKYQCCNFPSVKSNPSGCQWKHGDCGRNVNCGDGYVMSGACASGSGQECDGQHSHSAYCCPLLEKTGES